MSANNTVTLIGRLGQDPTLRYTANQTPVVEFSLAVDNRHNAGTDWFNVVAWAGLAETIAEHKTKGDQVAVRGHLTPTAWTGDDGQKRTTVKVTAEEVEFLTRKRTTPADTEAGPAGRLTRPAQGLPHPTRCGSLDASCRPPSRRCSRSAWPSDREMPADTFNRRACGATSLRPLSRALRVPPGRPAAALDSGSTT